MREDFDLFIVEGEAAVAIEQAIHTRQHFPSLKIVCLPERNRTQRLLDQASEQNIELVTTDCSDRSLRRQLRAIVSAFERTAEARRRGH